MFEFTHSVTFSSSQRAGSDGSCVRKHGDESNKLASEYIFIYTSSTRLIIFEAGTGVFLATTRWGEGGNACETKKISSQPQSPGCSTFVVPVVSFELNPNTNLLTPVHLY